MLAALAGCLAGPTGPDDPVRRSLTWFSFLDGADIRRSCERPAGTGTAPDRYRIVYNGRWGEQVRIYELDLPPRRPRPVLEIRVLPFAPLNAVRFDDPLALVRGARATVGLDDAQAAAIVAALGESGLGRAPAPRGLVLPSDGFYWVAAACIGGRFVFNAWTYPERWPEMRFAPALLAVDASGIALNPPRDEPPIPRQAPPDRPFPHDERNNSVFDLTVGAAGLRGAGLFF